MNKFYLVFLGQPKSWDVAPVWSPPLYSLLRSWASASKYSRLESGSETPSSPSQNNIFLKTKLKCFKAQVPFMPCGRCNSASHPCLLNGWGVRWTTFPMACCSLHYQGKEWCTSDTNGWRFTQGAWPLAGIGTYAVRTRRPMNGNFRTQMFHLGQDYSHSFGWGRSPSWIKVTSLPFASLESRSLCDGGISQNSVF